MKKKKVIPSSHTLIRGGSALGAAIYGIIVLTEYPWLVIQHCACYEVPTRWVIVPFVLCCWGLSIGIIWDVFNYFHPGKALQFSKHEIRESLVCDRPLLSATQRDIFGMWQEESGLPCFLGDVFCEQLPVHAYVRFQLYRPFRSSGCMVERNEDAEREMCRYFVLVLASTYVGFSAFLGHHKGDKRNMCECVQHPRSTSGFVCDTENVGYGPLITALTFSITAQQIVLSISSPRLCQIIF